MDYKERPVDWKEFKLSLANELMVDQARWVSEHADNPSAYPTVLPEWLNQCRNLLEGKLRKVIGGDVHLWNVSPADHFVSTFSLLEGKDLNDFICKVIQRAISCTNRIVRGIIDTWYIHTGHVITTEHWYSLFCKWFLAFLVDRGEELYKYQSCYLLCLLSHQVEFPEPLDLPQGEKPGFILPSGYFRYLRKGILVESDEFIALGYALTDVKRAGRPLSDARQAKFIEKHKRNMLGAEYKGTNNEEILTRVWARIMYLILELKKLCPDYTGPDGGKVKLIPVDRPFSLSSTHNFQRHNGGFWGEYLWDRRFAAYPDLNDQDYLDARRKEDKPLIGIDFVDNTLFERRAKSRYDTAEFKREFIYQEAEKRLKDGNIHCTVHKVLEPFKVRPITTGDGYIYHVVREIQKPFHSLMKRLRCFELIGKGFDSSVITKRLAGSTQLYWNSGDFSAATDGINKHLQNDTVDLICQHFDMPTLHEQCLRRSMDMHYIHYKSKHSDEVLLQDWGQLMGTPFSFLILCIINLACTWASCQITRDKELGYEDFMFFEDFDRIHRPLINGDDNLFGFSNMSYYEDWVNVCREAGLNRSLGKNYVSKNWLMLNSRPCWITRTNKNNRRISYVKEIFTCNSGLVRGQSRVLQDERVPIGPNTYMPDPDAELLASVDQFQHMCKGANLEQSKRLLERFVYNTRKRLKQTNRSWVLDRYLGGLGLDLTWSKPNYSQSKLAAAILMNDKDFPASCVQPERKLPTVQLDEMIVEEKMIEELRSLNMYVEPVVWTSNDPTPTLEYVDEIPTFHYTDGDFILHKVWKKVKGKMQKVDEPYLFKVIKSRFLQSKRKVLSKPYINPMNAEKRFIRVNCAKGGRRKISTTVLEDAQEGDLTVRDAWSHLEVLSLLW